MYISQLRFSDKNGTGFKRGPEWCNIELGLSFRVSTSAELIGGTITQHEIGARVPFIQRM